MIVVRAFEPVNTNRWMSSDDEAESVTVESVITSYALFASFEMKIDQEG